MNFLQDGKPDFFVLSLSTLLNDRSFEIGIRSFLKFYHTLTPKHRRRVYFVALDASSERSEMLDRQSAKLEQPHPVLFSMSSLQVQDLDSIRRQEAILLHSNPVINETARVELLSMCLPLLTFEHWERAHAFDNAACIFLRTSVEEQSAREFGNLLRILYFDPGALKMLREKALLHRRSASFRMAISTTY